jgi:nucleoside-triphosphatase
MNLRAAIILMGFSAISTELKNPIIKAVTMRRGMAELYHSVNLAFSALPAVFNMFPGTREFFRKPAKAFSGLFYHSSDLLATFEQQLENRPDVIIITGDLQQGKTTFVSRIIDGLKAGGVQIAGFLAIGVHEDGNRIGFDLFDIKTGITTLLCRDKGFEGVRFGRFVFSDEGLKAGAEIISQEKVAGSQVVIIDEIGPLELNRQGWWQPVTKLVESSRIPQLWVVRKNLLKAVISNWKIGDAYIFDIQKDFPADVGEIIKTLVKEDKNAG